MPSKVLKLSSLPNNHKDFVAININSDVSYPPNSKLFCNLCSCNLVLSDAAKEEWFCTRCKVSYFPNKGQKVKRANKFETTGPETIDTEISQEIKHLWFQ